MKFKLIKSSIDGICGVSIDYSSIDEALRDVNYHKGWSSLEEMHNSIREWAKRSYPGSIYATQATAIIAVGINPLIRNDNECNHCANDNLDYGELSTVEDGHIRQEVSCDKCGERWIDVFVLADQKPVAARTGRKNKSKK